MREILCRGKEIKTGKWVYGNYFEVNFKRDGEDEPYYTDHRIMQKDGRAFKVDCETVGQYTGIDDKFDNPIFEGDIMAFCKGATRPFEIRWDGLGWKMFTADGKRIKDSFESGEIRHMQKSEVIGNKWDNPELLEAKNENN